MKKYLLLGLFCVTTAALPMKIDRVIISTNDHPDYIQFWPLVAKAWTEIVGITPTLALIGDEDVQVDETLGDVIRFKPIEGVSTGNYARTIRLLMPALFPDDVCLITDMDILPLNKEYFLDSVTNVPDDHFVVYRDKVNYGAYKRGKKFPMCYNAAKGSVFAEVFNINSADEIEAIIQEWHREDYAAHKPCTDEAVLVAKLNEWEFKNSRVTKLGHGVERRIGRLKWGYKAKRARENYYVDAHMVRPYEKYKQTIDELAALYDLK